MLTDEQTSSWKNKELNSTQWKKLNAQVSSWKKAMISIQQNARKEPQGRSSFLLKEKEVDSTEWKEKMLTYEQASS